MFLEIIPVLDLVFLVHLQTKILQKFSGSVITHFLLTVVHSRNFKDNSKVSARLYRNGKARYLDAEDSSLLIVYAHSVVYLCAVPRLKLYDKVYLLADLYSTHTEQTSCVDDTDTSQFEEVTDIIR